MVAPKQNKLAVWAVTPNGVKLTDKLADNLPGVDIYVSQNLTETKSSHIRFETLSAALDEKFRQYTGHIFIMSAGIVVRILAPLIHSKTEDPAVVVVDDLGKNAISLLSGHLGGANELTRQISQLLGSNPVITTATDINAVPAIDVLARKKNLAIENPAAIKTVNMALLKGEKILIHDPFNILHNSLPNSESGTLTDLMQNIGNISQNIDIKYNSFVYIGDSVVELTSKTLILRPHSLVAGIGCNRNTGAEEIHDHLKKVLQSHRLATSSLKCLASIDVKEDEAGLISVAERLNLPLVFFERDELNKVEGIKNPSPVVEKHVGAKSVCEAAAILGAKGGTLIVPKQPTQNVTVAIARIGFSLSA